MSDVETPKVMTLSKTERIMFEGIQAREREAERTVLIPIREDLDEVLRAVHDRLGLPPGSIGTTHSLDTATWTVMMVPRPPAVGDHRGDDAPEEPSSTTGDGYEEGSMGETLEIAVGSNGATSRHHKRHR